MDVISDHFRDIVILGGGPSGLAAGYVLTQAGRKLLIVERNPAVGGLARTIEHRGFRFDLGGHRFITSNEKLERIVRKALRDELLVVPRSSKILLDDRYYDYPLKIRNALSGFGLRTCFRIAVEYLSERATQRLGKSHPVSLEEWVVQQFGRTLFDRFFRGYSEKVWGISCDQIAREWIDRRIQGLSLGTALKHAFFRSPPGRLRTLADAFLYPPLGIGQIHEQLNAEIKKRNQVVTNSQIIGINHANDWIESVTVKDDYGTHDYDGNDFISSIPLNSLARLLNPQPPEAILRTASRLRFRDLVVVTVMLNRERVTDQTWIYIPDPEIPFGRIHEPKNWSTKMAPEHMTHLVTEYFCFRGDAVWTATDEELKERTAANLHKLGFIEVDEIIDSVILRVPNAYPLFELNFLEHQKTLFEYFDRFHNLHLVGRGGRFEYYNTDHAMESGIAAAEAIMAQGREERVERSHKGGILL